MKFVIHTSFRGKLQKGVLLYIHINLTVSLLLAMIVFVTGVDHATFKKVRSLLITSKQIHICSQLVFI